MINNLDSGEAIFFAITSLVLRVVYFDQVMKFPFQLN
jgi:hypothetical protein